MSEREDKARSLLLRIYELTDGKLYLTVIPTELVEKRPHAPENAKPTMEDLQEALEPLGFLWFAGIIELTRSTIMLTPAGKEHVETMAKDFKAFDDEHPEALADDVSDDVH